MNEKQGENGHVTFSQATLVAVTLKMKEDNYKPYYLPLTTTCSLGSLRGRIRFFSKSQAVEKKHLMR